MVCMKCQRDLERCICDDIDARLEALRNSRHLLIDVERIKAVRFLAKHEIDADRTAAKLAEQFNKPTNEQ